MQRIDNLQNISDHVSALTGKKIGNLYWMADELKRRIEKGILFQVPARNGIGLVSVDTNRRQFCFQTDKRSADIFDCNLETAEPLVSELIFSYAAPEKCEAERRILRRLGFTRRFDVQMLSMRTTKAVENTPDFQEFILENAREQDIAALEALYRGVFDLETDDPPMGEMLARNIANGNLSVVRAKNGAVAGGVICDVQGRTAWIRHVAVAPSFQGKGIGKYMMRKTLENFPENMELRLWVKQNNTVALRMYRDLGFADGRLGMEIWRRQ